MRQTGANLGVEKSGHYYFKINGKEIFYYDDGILAAIEVINAVSLLPYSLADFSDLLPRYYRSGEINIKIQSQNSTRRQKIKEHFADRQIQSKGLLGRVETTYKNQATKISRLDGLTMEFNQPADGWWFNLRFSNTEPFARLNIEAENKQTLEKEKKKMLNLIK